MPHISLATIHRFARAVALIDINCATAVDYVGNSLTTSLHHHVKLKRLTCRSSYVNKVLDMAKMAVLVDLQDQNMGNELGLAQAGQLWTRFICSAMSFVAVDDENEPVMVFLAEADQKRLIKPRLLLIKSSYYEGVHMLRDVAIQLYGHMAKLLGISIEASW